MTSKKPHPLLAKAKKNHSTKPRRRNWLIAILTLPIPIVAYVFLSQSTSETIVAPMDIPVAAVEPIEDSSSATDDAITLENTALDNTALENDAFDSIDQAGLDDTIESLPSTNAIVNAPIPATDSLAKEEIDRLADERKRLVEQEQAVVEQVEMAKDLTKMKAQQIELLEAQIAQLEAENASQ